MSKQPIGNHGLGVFLWFSVCILGPVEYKNRVQKLYTHVKVTLKSAKSGVIRMMYTGRTLCEMSNIFYFWIQSLEILETMDLGSIS